MIPSALRNFINQLQSATEQGRLVWHEADALAYYCDHKNHTLHLGSHFDEERGLASFFFRVVTGGKSTPFSVNEDESDYVIMRNLYEAVVANANDVGEDLAGFFD